MLWNILDKESSILYVNRDIDLKIKVIGVNEKDEIFMNYKGCNLTLPMLVWEFGEDLCLASIEDVCIRGEKPCETCFIVNRKDRDAFMDEIYFFLIDNNMDSVLHERYQVNWE